MAANDWAQAIPAVISAIAALGGVCVGQVITWQQRRGDEARRRRSELSQTVALALSLIVEATEQINRGAQSQIVWQAQPAWNRLRTDMWPPVRTRLLMEAALQTNALGPSRAYALALQLQHLLADEGDNHEVAVEAWDAASKQVIAMRASERPTL